MTIHPHDSFSITVNNLWTQLRDQHSRWIVSRLRESEDDILLCVPKDRVSELGTIRKLTSDDLAAEKAFSGLCESLQAIGFAISIEGEGDSARPISPRPIRYRWLTTPRVGSLQLTDEDLQELGWTADQANQAEALSQHADSIAERIASVAGRLICHRPYLQERDTLRTEWQALAPHERPELPLVRSTRSSGDPLEVAQRSRETDSQIELFRIDGDLDRFVRNFDSFCDRWALDGLATWSLPNPRGPHWPVVTPNEREHGSNFQTPWHFWIQDQDGFGDLPRRHHAALAANRGLDDLRRWQVAGQLLRIDHWQHVLESRDADHQRVRNSRTQLQWLLAQLVDLDPDRVKRLRRAIRDLQTGRRTSLAGVR